MARKEKVSSNVTSKAEKKMEEGRKGVGSRS